MEAIGTEVMVVLSFPVIAVTFLVVYYWDNIKAFFRHQYYGDVRM